MSDFKQAALDFCNQVRADAGLPPASELSKGVPVNAYFCPISKTIGDPEGATGTVMYSGGSLSCYTNYDLPTLVRSFVRSFDAGLYPELEEHETIQED